MNTFEKARLGSWCLQEAVLDVLLHNYGSEVARVHNPKAIGETAGIFREKGNAGLNDAIVSGILNELEEMGKVKKRGDARGAGWTLTDKEYSMRKRTLYLRPPALSNRTKKWKSAIFGILFFGKIVAWFFVD